MYIDARKLNIRKMSESEVAREKAFTIEIYKRWMDSNASDIADRTWEINDIGIAENVGEFIKLIKEAELTYSFGAMQSAIALIGIAAEDLCRFFADLCSKNMDSLSQFDRIEKLHSIGLIDSTVKNEFHKIRKLRNDCLHYNKNFATKSANILKSEALEAINTLKSIYSSLIGVVDYSTISPQKLTEIICAIAEEAEKENGSIAGIADAQLRIRNIFHSVTGFNLSLDNGGTSEFRGGIYRVDEIDLDPQMPEICLFDTASNFPVIIDLNPEDIAFIHSNNISANDIIFASIASVTDKLGMTSKWNFAAMPKKI